MLKPWIEILPLFLVRILAVKYSERFVYNYGEHRRKFAQARPDVYFKVDDENYPYSPTNESGYLHH